LLTRDRHVTLPFAAAAAATDAVAAAATILAQPPLAPTPLSADAQWIPNPSRVLSAIVELFGVVLVQVAEYIAAALAAAAEQAASPNPADRRSAAAATASASKTQDSMRKRVMDHVLRALVEPVVAAVRLLFP
jgi:hypothetical protein